MLYPPELLALIRFRSISVAVRRSVTFQDSPAWGLFPTPERLQNSRNQRLYTSGLSIETDHLIAR
jgi:hypothetical protein